MSMAFLKEIETVGVIGTAGRGSDGRKLNAAIYERMYATVSWIVGPRFVEFVSGGAAWADHLAVKQFLYSPMQPALSLMLPTDFTDGRYEETKVYNGYNVGSVSNFYHTKFSQATNCDSLKEIQSALKRGAKAFVGKGFFDRNLQIAKADTMIAFTFGDGPKLKDGGTAHTAKAYFENGGKKLYHVNLTDYSIHTLDKWPV